MNQVIKDVVVEQVSQASIESSPVGVQPQIIIGLATVIVGGSLQAYRSYLSNRLAENALNKGQQIESVQQNGDKLTVRFRVNNNANDAVMLSKAKPVEVSKQILQTSLNETKKNGSSNTYTVKSYKIDSVAPAKLAVRADAAESSDVSDTMDEFNAQWYNALIKGLQLDPDHFQLYQSTASLGFTTEWVWQLADTMPPMAANNYFSNSLQSFSQNYGAMLSNLKPAGDADLSKALGDKYNDYLNFIANDFPDSAWDDPKQGQKILTRWCNQNGVPGAVNACMASIYLNQIAHAQTDYASAQFAKKGFAYNKTIQMVTDAMSQGTSREFSFTSKSESTSLEHTWAKGGLKVGFSLFSFKSNAGFDKLSESSLKSGLKVNVHFDKVQSISVAPLTAVSKDAYLKDFLPWFNSSAMQTAFKNNDNDTWGHGVPSWEDCFTEDGLLPRNVSNLVLVDGIDITITSDANYSKEQQQEIEGQAETGYWPFFSASGEGGQDNKVTFDEEGQMTVTIKNKKGNPQVLGVLVNSIAQ